MISINEKKKMIRIQGNYDSPLFMLGFFFLFLFSFCGGC